jgi:hypothetical protein
MSAHLSSEQISRWTAGDHAPEAYRHIQECAQCAAEVARLENLFEEFGYSVSRWSALQRGADTPGRWMRLESRRGVYSGMLRWKLVAAALVIAFAVPLWINLKEHRSQIEAMDMDARLLEEVNASISRSAPASMEPLMQLIACEPDAAAKY